MYAKALIAAASVGLMSGLTSAVALPAETIASSPSGGTTQASQRSATMFTVSPTIGLSHRCTEMAVKLRDEARNTAEQQHWMISTCGAGQTVSVGKTVQRDGHRKSECVAAPSWTTSANGECPSSVLSLYTHTQAYGAQHTGGEQVITLTFTTTLTAPFNVHTSGVGAETTQGSDVDSSVTATSTVSTNTSAGSTSNSVESANTSAESTSSSTLSTSASATSTRASASASDSTTAV
ncbi:hypothetical protein K431DRAFT_332824 [Polychaeton citri CBS 116435]|uniref:Uncharacterized protein n=1 Tax=Polychaeton citri CBS 116435 TaxID=1314669 RepID=A0A9P4Q0U0_9PEZI|nr:hypothetical protein K431DRAFT_332824 [Polychaeton citri CBS 116435]